MIEGHAVRKLTANRVPAYTLLILGSLLLTSFLIAFPLSSFAAVFDVKDEFQYSDIEGNKRPLRQDVDIGAYEFTPNL